MLDWEWRRRASHPGAGWWCQRQFLGPAALGTVGSVHMSGTSANRLDGNKRETQSVRRQGSPTASHRNVLPGLQVPFGEGPHHGTNPVVTDLQLAQCHCTQTQDDR